MARCTRIWFGLPPEPATWSKGDARAKSDRPQLIYRGRQRRVDNELQVWRQRQVGRHVKAVESLPRVLVAQRVEARDEIGGRIRVPRRARPGEASPEQVGRRRWRPPPDGGIGDPAAEQTRSA